MRSPGYARLQTIKQLPTPTYLDDNSTSPKTTPKDKSLGTSKPGQAKLLSQLQPTRSRKTPTPCLMIPSEHINLREETPDIT